MGEKDEKAVKHAVPIFEFEENRFEKFSSKFSPPILVIGSFFFVSSIEFPSLGISDFLL